MSAHLKALSVQWPERRKKLRRQRFRTVPAIDTNPETLDVAVQVLGAYASLGTID